MIMMMQKDNDTVAARVKNIIGFGRVPFHVLNFFKSSRKIPRKHPRSRSQMKGYPCTFLDFYHRLYLLLNLPASSELEPAAGSRQSARIPFDVLRLHIFFVSGVCVVPFQFVKFELDRKEKNNKAS